MTLKAMHRQHERLMEQPPYPHDGWALCQCALARAIRREEGMATQDEARE